MQLCAYFVAIRAATKQCTFRALAATEDVMVALFSVLDFRWIKDLQMADMMESSYGNGLRGGQLRLLRRKLFRMGTSEHRADINLTPDASKVNLRAVGP